MSLIDYKAFVERAFARRERALPEPPETIAFTDTDGVTRDLPFAEVAAGARKRRRIDAAKREARIRKGTRRFNRQQRERRYAVETNQALYAILQAGPGGTLADGTVVSEALHRNVLNGLVAKYGPQLEAADA